VRSPCERGPTRQRGGLAWEGARTGITESIAAFGTHVIQSIGYAGVFLLMVAESMVLPVPSEAVMPFAGFTVAEGSLSWAGVIGFATLGSIVGSLMGYAIGRWGGRPFVSRFGKYFLIDADDLAWTDGFFQRRGNLTILVARFIPIVRHLISIPAGISRMKLLPFCLFTIVGAGLWNAFLTGCGYLLRKNWDAVLRYSRVIDIVVLALLVLLVAWYVGRHLLKRRRSA
jgi:membrane protein DedA with SNARE-associated domain